MKNVKHVNRQRARLIAMTMAVVLAVPSVITPVNGAVTSVAAIKAEAKAASGASASVENAEELKNLVRANLIKNYDPERDGEMDIVHSERSRYASDQLTYEAQTLQANADDRPAKYQLYDINRDENTEMFIRWKEGAKYIIQIHRYDDYSSLTKRVAAFSDVTDIRTNAKKKQIVIVTTTGKKKTITAYKLNDSGKLKTVSTYTKSGKTYKKGSKKITKKAFNSYNKTVNKLAKFVFTKIPDIDYSYAGVDEVFYGKGIYYRWVSDEVGQETLIMSKGSKDTPEKDRFIAYSYAYDQTGWHEYSAEGGIERFVFGPNQVDKKTGKTYREEDWEAMKNEYFGGAYAPDFLTETTCDDGTKVLGIEEDGALYSVEATDVEAYNGSTKYKAREYRQEYGDSQLRMVFFTEGPYKGRIVKVGIFYPHITGDTPHELWKFTYGTEAGNPAETDPEIEDQVTFGGVTEGVKPRTLNIYGGSGELAETVKVGENVRYILYGNGSGQFYTYTSYGTKQLLPVEMELVDGRENEAWVDYENTLNPANGQTSFGDPAFKEHVFWEPLEK